MSTITVSYLEEIADSIDNPLLSELTTQSAARKPGNTQSSELNVNPNYSLSELHELSQLLDEFRDCFAAETRVGRTNVAKHKCITADITHSVCQPSYRGSLKEREVIQEHVRKMLEDDVI